MEYLDNSRAIQFMSFYHIINIDKNIYKFYVEEKKMRIHKGHLQECI